MTGYLFSVDTDAGGWTPGGSDVGAGGGTWAGDAAVGGGSSSTSVSSWRTVLLARRSSRKIFPTVRMTSGRRSGPMTISAIARIRAISKRSKIR